MEAGFCMHPQLSFLVQAGNAADSDTSPEALAPEGLTACKTLFAQLPWEDIAQLEVAVIRKDVQLPLIQFLRTVAMQVEGNADATELMHSAMTVSEAGCSVSLASQEPISLSLHLGAIHPQTGTEDTFDLLQSDKGFLFCVKSHQHSACCFARVLVNQC